MTNANQVFGRFNSTANTRKNTTKTMKSTKIVIAVNLNVASIGRAQEVNPDSKVFMNVHNGSIKWNGSTRKVFIDFQPTPAIDTAKFTPVFEVSADGSRKELDRVEFWADICGTNNEGFINTARITANLDMTVNELKELVESGAKALEFTFDTTNADTAFIFAGISEAKIGKLKTSAKEVMLRFGPAVTSDVTDNVILSDATYIHANVVASALANSRDTAPSAGISDMKAATSNATVSARRRATRRANHEAATTPVVKSSISIAQLMNKAAAPAAPAPAAPATTNSTDAKLDAILNMVGNLQTQIAELKAENAALRAENDALKGNTNTSQPQSEAARASLDTVVEEAPKAPQSFEECFDMFGEELDEDEYSLPEEAQSFDSFDIDEDEEGDFDVFSSNASKVGSQALV